MVDRVAFNIIAVSLTAFALGLILGALFFGPIFQLKDIQMDNLFQYLQPALIISVVGTGIAATKFILDYFIYQPNIRFGKLIKVQGGDLLNSLHYFWTIENKGRKPAIDIRGYVKVQRHFDRLQSVMIANISGNIRTASRYQLTINSRHRAYLFLFTIRQADEIIFADAWGRAQREVFGRGVIRYGEVGKSYRDLNSKDLTAEISYERSTKAQKKSVQCIVKEARYSFE
jgi:hypothetical protein